MGKDDFWFRHDSTAGRGLKMRRMSHKYDHWGKGVYWDVCEVLRMQKSYQYESAESALTLLADLIGVKDTNRFLEWWKESTSIGLLQKRGKFFFSPALSENMSFWEKQKKNGQNPKKPKPKTSQTEASREPSASNTEYTLNTGHGRENNELKNSRAPVFEKMEKHIRKNLKKYYPSEVSKAEKAILDLQNQKGWTQEKVNSNPAIAAEFDAADKANFEKFIGGKMRNEMQECWDYYSARNFFIDGQPITAWASVMAGWMKRRKQA